MNADHSSASDHIPAAEWIVSGMGLLLVVASLGFLGYRAVSETGPAEFDCEVVESTPSEGQFLATVAVHNRGGRPIAQFECVIHCQPDEISREVRFDYLPSHSQRLVHFRLPSDPRRSSLNLEVLSYQDP